MKIKQLEKGGIRAIRNLRESKFRDGLQQLVQEQRRKQKKAKKIPHFLVLP